MHDRAFGTYDRFEGARDQRFARLSDDLRNHPIGEQSALDHPANEVEIGLRGRRKAELDLLEAHGQEQPQKRAFSLMPHGVGQGLVTVAQVDAAPSGRSVERAIGPLSVGQVYAVRGSVTRRVEGHRMLWSWAPESDDARASSSPQRLREEEVNASG